MSELIIIWTRQAKKSLKSIYDYYKEKSLQGAKNVKNDILQSPKTIRFSKQYQQDDINPASADFQSVLKLKDFKS
jgi:plasmid stabilization system protein ParE